MEGTNLIKKKIRMVLYTSMVLGLCYIFYNSIVVHGLTNTVIIGTILGVIFSILFIELLVYVLPKFIVKKKRK